MGTIDLQIPQEAIRDAVSAVIVTMLGDNRDETLRNMISGVLESKGTYGRLEFENLVLNEIRERAALIVHEMLSGDDVKELIRQSIVDRLEGFTEQFLNKFMVDLEARLGRSW